MKSKKRQKGHCEVDGIWAVEAYGYKGWEGVSTAFFDDGRYRAGGADHYTNGTYNLNGRALVIKAKGHQWGRVRLVHGDKKVHSKIVGIGKLKRDGSVIDVTFKDQQMTRSRLQVRYTRLSDL